MPLDERTSAEYRKSTFAFLWESFRALLPTLAFDVGGTTLVYYALLPHYPKTSVWPILGASLVPAVSNVFTFVRRKSVDIVGLFILLGMIAGLIPAAFGGGQRLLLLRESFVTGALGVVLVVSPFVMRHPIGYYVIREFLTADETLPEEHFEVLWRSTYFRRGIRIVTIAWGALLLGELVLRAFMALRMNIAFVLSVSPVILTVLMLLAGVATAIWLSGAISRALRE
ncbi:MAG TPA: VC0807 family protein [Candidatus Baltobacteraceae bacterium]|nr:VC0807 family protein [Candidatus Baltobacteraceae bacterium]